MHELVLGFTSSVTYFGKPWWDRQDETVSKLEFRAGDDLGGVGAVREPPKTRAFLEAPLR